MRTALREWFESLATKFKAALAILAIPYERYPDVDNPGKDGEPDINVLRGPFF